MFNSLKNTIISDRNLDLFGSIKSTLECLSPSSFTSSASENLFHKEQNRLIDSITKIDKKQMASNKAIEQYQQSPFAIQQLLGLSKPTIRNSSNSIEKNLPDHLNLSEKNNKFDNFTNSNFSSDDTESKKLRIDSNSSKSSQDGEEDEDDLLNQSRPSSTSSSISVGSINTSFSASNRNPFTTNSLLSSSSSSLSVNNLVNSSSFADLSQVYFSSSSSTTSSSVNVQSRSAINRFPSLAQSILPDLTPSMNEKLPNLLESTSISAPLNQKKDSSSGQSINNQQHQYSDNHTKIYFNSQAAAAFMSAASVHVGLNHHQQQQQTNHKPNGFTSALFNPFVNSDQNVQKFGDKNTGKFQSVLFR